MNSIFDEEPDIAVALDHAMLWHQLWKDKLHEAVAEQLQLDVAIICCEDGCDLGKWLRTDGKRRYGNKPDFTNLLKRHREFHQVAGHVAMAINGNEYRDARAMLGERSQFAYASIEVSVAIMKFKMAVAG
jgi:methyl-accepting chemotaxis protein